MAILVLATPCWATPPQLQFTLEGMDTPLTFTRLAEPTTTFQVSGLPFPGEVLWRPAAQELAYRHPAEGSWLLATPALLPKPTVSTSTLPRAMGPSFQGQPTRRWAQSVGNESCGVLFGSAPLGAQQGLNIGDIQYLYRLLYWLNAGMMPPRSCGYAQTLAATAPQVGLPTRWQSPLGLLVFQGVLVAPEDDATLSWPSQTYPVTEEVRLRLLLAQLPVQARAEFIRDNATLPLSAQVAKLATLLAEMGEDTPQ